MTISKHFATDRTFMIHDPLCTKHIRLASEIECSDCNLIIAVRNDEREKIKNYVLKLKPRNRIWILRSIKRKELNWNLGVEWAIDVILNHPTLKPQSSSSRSAA